jgi:hypothetical protein
MFDRGASFALPSFSNRTYSRSVVAEKEHPVALCIHSSNQIELRTALLSVAATVQSIAMQFYCSNNILDIACVIACVHVHTIEKMDMIGLNDQLRWSTVCK